MPTSITEHLEHGIVVECANGRKVKCAPLSLRDAKFFIEIWDRLAAAKTVSERVEIRVEMASRFAEIYPDLAPHIGAGDVEALLPRFFWMTTGAKVLEAPSNGRNGAPRSTGTTRRRNIAPSGA